MNIIRSSHRQILRLLDANWNFSKFRLSRFKRECSINSTVLGLMMLVAALAISPNMALANLVVLDQEVDAFGSSNPNGPLGGPSIEASQSALQTFTVGIGGTLDAIDVQVQHGGKGIPTSALVLTMRPTLPNGDPDRTHDFGSVSLPASSIPEFNDFTSASFTSFDVSGLNINVLPGDQLSFELSSTTSLRNYFVFESQSDIYVGGNEFLFSPADGAFFEVNRDLGFRTFVTVPEPASSSFIGFAGVLAVINHRPRRAFVTTHIIRN